jgi:hypothetical protein
MNTPNYILEDNLKAALFFAIESLKEKECIQHGPEFRSCQRAAFEDNLEALKRGEPLIILYT